MRRLPTGIQDFTYIRENGFCYVDKTALIHRLITGSGKSFFLSRPRRFGKSLLCSTLESIFEGKKELFGDISGFPALAINSLEWKWKKYPIIRLSLNIGNYSKGIEVLESALIDSLNNIALNHNLILRGALIPQKFSNLIFDLRKKFNERVVVLIDEYDKPLLDTIEKKEIHIDMRNELKAFYGILKFSDENLQFVLLTGITKFSHVSIFSDLNQLDDITLDPCYSDICGITQEEMEQNFKPEINKILKDTGKNRDEYIRELRQYYNGYRFSENPLTMYNPFGLLNHFNKNGKFLPYWYESGTPTFLINIIASQKVNIIKLSNIQVGYDSFRKYDIENMKAEPLLYQCGYLTITDYLDEIKQYTLDFPNDEVRLSFSKSLLDHYLQSTNNITDGLNTKLINAIFTGDIDETMNTLRQFLASIPYDIIKDTENYYETTIHLIFTMLGLNCRSEVRISSGRIDTLVETKNFVFCFEFKLDGDADKALAQIDTKDYLLSWKGSEKKLYKVGVNFDRNKRNIGDWKYLIE
ncbi:MAG: ATP-binding protein [Treponema sp.]|nr:ATP-binding protein [Treponema sp.]